MSVTPKPPISATSPHRKKAVRLFSGMAGSPLAYVVELPATAPAPVKRGRGRPAKFANKAAKQRAYRDKRRSIDDAWDEALIANAEIDQLKRTQHGFAFERKYGREYAPGSGVVILGGGSAEMDAIDAAHQRDLDGRKVRPQGHGPAKVDEDFVYSSEKRGWGGIYDDARAAGEPSHSHAPIKSRHLKRPTIIRMRCPTHDKVCIAKRISKSKTFKLECGCIRSMNIVTADFSGSDALTT